MAYLFHITTDEFESLAWIADRYSYAETLWNELKSAWMNDDNGIDWRQTNTLNLAEHQAWNIQSAVESEDGYLTCLGGRLKDEVDKLLNAIV